MWWRWNEIRWYAKCLPYRVLCGIGLHKWIKCFPDDTFHTCRNCARMSDGGGLGN
jgi:hypothetical protein